ncbi:MAG: SDR family NAD(P)-dependent oxidoreductase [Solirubrobacterales bacterium]
MADGVRDLAGRTALVTGGSRGIGREAALALGRRGADVVVTFRERGDAAEEVVKLLDALGVRGAVLQVDLSGTAQLDRMCAELREKLGECGVERLDILVNNAGIQRHGTFDEITESDLDAIYETNYKSPFFLTQRLVGEMNDGGRIVNIGSRTARTVYDPLVAYGPLKAALQSLTVYLANFLGPRRIAVNAVAPDGLEGDFNAKAFAETPEARDYIVDNTAVGRIGVPADIGGAIAFLCSPEAEYINGAVLPIDGGFRL